MIRLDSKANFSGIGGGSILKVLRLKSATVSLFKPEQVAVLITSQNELKQLNDSLHSFGTVISVGPDLSNLEFRGLKIFQIKNPEVIAEGDVIRYSRQNKSINILFRQNSTSNTLFITNQCNSRCLMCSQPPTTDEDTWLLDELEQAIPLMNDGIENIGITGGEPLLAGDRLAKIIGLCRDYLPQTSLHVLTNGRLFRDAQLTKLMVNQNHPNLVWAIPLYSDTLEDHDYIVQSKGAFRETIQGLYELASYEELIELRIVLQKPSLERLEELAYFIFKNLSFVAHVAFMGIEPFGYAKKNKDILFSKPDEFAPKLESAAFFLLNRGINVSVYNLPLCLLPKSLWPIAKKSISDWKNKYLPQCSNCDVLDECSGFFEWAEDDWIGGEITPIVEEVDLSGLN